MKTAITKTAGLGIVIVLIIIVVVAGYVAIDMGAKSTSPQTTGVQSSESITTTSATSSSVPVTNTNSNGNQTVTIALANPLNNLDPPDSNNPDNLNLDLAIYDNLVRFNENMQIIPDLATSWTLSANQTTWTFQLRQNVRFSDGTPLNATAVKINLDRDRNASSGLSHSSLFTMISAVNVLSTYSISITTSYPFAALLNNLAHPSGGIISPVALSKWGKSVSAHPDGSGPWEVQSLSPSSEVDLVRNPYYWGNVTNVNQIRVMVVPDSSTRLSMLQSGQADVVEGVPPSSATSITSAAGLKLVVTPSELERYVGFNVNVKPFNDVRVRQALNYAVNRSALIQVVYDGYAQKPTSPAAPNVTGYSAVTPFYNYNPTLAKQLLAEAGYPNGFNATMITGNSQTSILLAQAVQSMFAAVGVHVSIQSYPFGTEIGKLTTSENQSQTQLYMLRWFPSSGDAYWVLWPLFNTAAFPPAGYNYGFFSNATIDNVINKGLNTINGRQAYFTQAQDMIVQQAPWVFLVVEDQLTGMQQSVTGVQIWPANTIYFNNIAVQ
ncbi:MAG: ABC transporter substrate-binding protein [Thaumarchaeota archaeon]|nr:ABC transporter substrate-binding protein [Nitrososphaerota archaeon]